MDKIIGKNINPESTIRPIVITSKPAQDHLLNIHSQFKENLDGIKNQSIRIAQINMAKTIEDKQQRELDAQMNKERMDSERKDKELDIKMKALTL